ncbi:MAG TPA: hypothetical protein VFS51_12505 [Gemmatimonadales bacterium]|nr:hypothetical protein [Gemmatimonadales bacterium]
MRWRVPGGLDEAGQLKEHGQIVPSNRATEQSVYQRIHALDVFEPVAELFEDPIRGWLHQGQGADAIRVFDCKLER